MVGSFPVTVNESDFGSESGREIFLVGFDRVGRVGRVLVVEVVVGSVHHKTEKLQFPR